MFFKRKSLTQNLQKSQNVAKNRGEVNFTQEILLNEICENLKFLLKKVRGEQFYKGNPFKQNLRSSQIFLNK